MKAFGALLSGRMALDNSSLILHFIQLILVGLQFDIDPTTLGNVVIQVLSEPNPVTLL
jgi:hypothetical protein